MARLRYFDALPPYFGGKRKLVKAIFKLAPPASDAPVFADAFLGGGSVSIMAKAMGYEVLCNDIAERSYLVGKALIENNRTEITKADIYRLFIPNEGDKGFIQDNFCPDVFMSKHAAFLDNAFRSVNEMHDSPKKWLLKYLLVKVIFQLRPHAQFSSPNAFNIPMEDRKIEYIKNRTYAGSIKTALKAIPDLVSEVARTVNQGIIDNARDNQAYKDDVREFISNIKADVVYFDPPYAGTSAYEDVYHVLDQILAGRRFPKEKSEFSAKDGQKLIGDVFHAARHIPVWILSMGNAGGKNDCMDELVEMMKEHRYVEAYQVKYTHMGGQSSEEHKEKNREYILLGVNST